MCHLLTIAVSGYSGDVPALFLERGLKAAAAANPHVQAALPSNALALDITLGGCSCSVYGPLQLQEFDEEKERDRYRRRGWSQLKTERAVEAKRNAWHRRESKPDAASEGFVRTVERIARSGGSIALAAHFYNGRFNEELVSLQSQIRIPIDEFVARSGAFPEDTVVIVHAEKHSSSNYALERTRGG